MFENVQSQPAAADPHRMGGTALVPAPKNNAKRRKAELTEAAKAKLHGRLMNWFMQERDKQAENRFQQAIDEDFYDGLQWSDEDALELMNRGQAPLVYNQIKPTINWMLGTERRTRIDGKVLPREEDDEVGAETKTKLLKYLSDVNRTQFTRSQTWKSCIVAGIGWMEDAVETDPSKELLATRYVDWKQIYYDSNSKEMDLSDARYLARWSFIDLDQALAMFPNKRATIEGAAIESNQVTMDEDDVWYLGSRVNTASSGDYANTNRRGMHGTGSATIGRERVKIIEMWYRVPVACKVCRSEDIEARAYHGEEFDPSDAEMVRLKDEGFLSVANHVKQEMRVCLMTETTLLYEGKSPYKHDRFPFTPMWCYRKNRDLLPYGVVRDIRDPQIDFNKRASKALFILSTNSIVMEEGAVEDVDELRREAARPDRIIVKKRGSELIIDRDVQLAEEHLKLMNMDGQMIRDVGGVTDQNLGKDDKGLSGQAIGKLQDQGSIVTAALFDNMRLAIQLQSEIQLSLMEQFYTAAKVVRIVGENKPVEWLKINQWDEGAAQFINDITRSKADFIVSEQDFKASIRQAMFESMMELISKLEPQVGLALLDMVIDFADVPNKEELVARIRKINGQIDPSRKPTPEEQQAASDKQQKAAAMEQMQMETVQAQLDKIKADAKAADAKAETAMASIQKTIADGIQTMVTASYEALQAAQIVATVPNVTPIADAILAGAGYQDQGGQDPNIPEPSGAMPAMTPQSKHGDYIGAAGGAPAPELQQGDGAAAGIETMAADGLNPPQGV